MSIIALAQGRAKVKNISFETALGLIDFMTKIIKNSKINLLFHWKPESVLSGFFYASKAEAVKTACFHTGKQTVSRDEKRWRNSLVRSSLDC